VSKVALPPGTTVNDRYVLNGKLGSDGDVYKAHDRYLDQEVALKLMHPDGGGTPQSWDEAKRLEQLRSRFIVPVINADVVISSDIRFVTTPLLSHGDLEAVSRPHGICVGLAVRFGHQIASGIDTVHAAGMVHRDIKPANVLKEGDTVLVSDVAFCSLLDADGRAPRNGSWCTLAPEAAPDDGYCSVATDVYSLAATTFYLLSSEYPVDHRLPPEEQKALITAGAVRDVGDIAPHVPRAVAMVVRRGLNVDPSARHPSAEAFGNALATALGRRRVWRRVHHDGHAYCAESAPALGHGPLGVCAEPVGRDQVRMRAFHLVSGRALSGVAEKTARVGAASSMLRSFFARLI
jgi:serine/threonine-protein kinase